MPLQINGATSGSTTIQATDATTQTLTLPSGGGTLLSTTSPKVGNVIQVVQAIYSTQTSNSTNTYADTGLTATITPTSASSKILVLVCHSENQKDVGASLTRIKMVIARNGSALYQFASDGLFTNSSSVNTGSILFNLLDSPATTSATTYKTQFASNGAAGAVFVQNGNIPSTITLMEIAA